MNDQDNNNQPAISNNGQPVMPNNNLEGQNLIEVQPVVNTMGANPNPVNNVYPQQNLNTDVYPQQVSINHTSNPNLAYNQNLNSTPVVNNSELTVPMQMANNQQVTSNGNDSELLKAFIGNHYENK